MSNFLTDQQILWVIKTREEKEQTFEEMADSFNKKFKDNKTSESIKKTYYRYRDMASDQDFQVRSIRDIARRKKTQSGLAKENKILSEYVASRGDILESIGDLIKKMPKMVVKVPKPVKRKEKRNMTLELMVSDVHYGKKTKNVGIEVIRNRVRKMSQTTVNEILRERDHFNVEKIVLSMIGDIIENADFHGIESQKGCEFSTSKQVYEAIQSLMFDLILPIAKTGIEIEALCVTGNHDRIGHDKTYNNPGEENLTFIIYKTLELLCNSMNLKNIKFNIVDGLHAHTSIYGNVLLIEHGDELKNLNKDTVANLLSKRQNQINKMISFFRFGHWHEPVIYGQGRMIGNGSVPGQDSYAESKGFMSEPIQILNYYVENKKRPTCFFRSFPIYLITKDEGKS